MQTELEKAKSFKHGSSRKNISETDRSKIMSAGQEFAVSAVSAGLAHVIHHPLYTLKSQMMFYGADFRASRFFRQALQQKHNFLYRGKSERLEIANLMMRDSCKCPSQWICPQLGGSLIGS